RRGCACDRAHSCASARSNKTRNSGSDSDMKHEAAVSDGGRNSCNADAEAGSPELAPPFPQLRVRWLGRMTFSDGLALQDELVATKRCDHPVPDEILLLEHDPVYTIGRTPDQSSLRGVAH